MLTEGSIVAITETFGGLILDVGFGDFVLDLELGVDFLFREHISLKACFGDMLQNGFSSTFKSSGII